MKNAMGGAIAPRGRLWDVEISKSIQVSVKIQNIVINY
jgi:hypothetical protein